MTNMTQNQIKEENNMQNISGGMNIILKPLIKKYSDLLLKMMELKKKRLSSTTNLSNINNKTISLN
ncbi:MAG: hypothetical protein MJ250_07915 [Alphaproteobacteria bacterium]|nr:hypothetical protein [Alphaproteobacteria bacterium]